MFVWTGGNGKDWEKKENWNNGRVPVKNSFGTDFVFTSANGTVFSGIGDLIRAASFTFPTNCGKYVFEAGTIIFGGSMQESREDGYILEDVFRNGLVVNDSPHGQTFKGRSLFKHDTVIENNGGTLVFDGGLEGPDRSLTKKGPGDVIINGGKFSAAALVMDEGRIALNGCSAEVFHKNGISGDNKLSHVMVLNGSTLSLPGDTGAFNIRPAMTISGKGASVDFGGHSVMAMTQPWTVADGMITNCSAFYVVMNSKAPTNTVTIGPGAKICTKGFVLGYANQNEIRQGTASNLVLNVSGTDKAPTVINLNGGNFEMGRCIGRGKTEDLHALFSGHVSVNNAKSVIMPVNGGSKFSLKITDGVKINSSGFKGCYNCRTGTVAVTGKDTVWDAGKETFGVVVAENTSAQSERNRVRIGERAAVRTEGQFNFLYRSGWKTADRDDTDNLLLVDSGAFIRSKGGSLISARCGGEGSVHDNSVLFRGNGTVWNAGGGNISLIYAADRSTSGNSVSVQDGAAITNVSDFSFAIGSGGGSSQNRLNITGASIYTRGRVTIAKNSKYHKRKGSDAPVSSNVVVIAGRDGNAAVWDFGNNLLSIGSSDSSECPSTDNCFVVGRNAILKNAGNINIGTERVNGSSQNFMELAGGQVEARNISVYGKCGIALDASKQIRPIRISENVVFGDDSLISIKNHSKAGRDVKILPVLMWKGRITGADKVKLAEGSSLWELVIEENEKRIYAKRKN